MMYAQQLADMGQVDEGLALAKAQLTGTPGRPRCGGATGARFTFG